MEGFNFGSLIGRILGEKKYFLIKDGTCYNNNKYEGPLLCKMFSYKFIKNSKGFLTVNVYGGEKINEYEMYKKIGWDLNEFYFLKNFDILSKDEKLVIEYIIKMRLNPKLFNQYYVDAYKNLFNVGYINSEYFENENKTFFVDVDCIKSINKFLYFNSKKLINFKNDDDIIDFLNILKVYLIKNEEDEKNIKYFIRWFDIDSNPLKICLKIIHDKNIIKQIFNKFNNKIAIKIFENNNRLIVIFVFLKI